MDAAPVEYTVIEARRGPIRTLYQGPSLRVAAKTARKRASEGCNARLRGTNGFRERLYRTDLAECKRWWYVEFCPRCGRAMFPDTRSNTCRKCWDPRESEAHMAAVRILNENRRKSR